MRRALFAAALAALAACSIVTNDVQAKRRACNFCPDNTLEHVVCPAGADEDDTDAGLTYALKSIELGWNPAEWDAGHVIGLDQDCADRSVTGSPPLCLISFGSDAGWLPRAALPRGVDNSLSLATWSAEVDGVRIGEGVESEMNRELDQGVWGMVLQVGGWNGSDDDSVNLLLAHSQGVVAAPPRWDGGDSWYAVGQDGADGGIIDTSFSGGVAYVTQGRLVWDAHDVRSAVLRLQNNEYAHDGLGAAAMGLNNLTAFGTISADKVDLTLAGGWSDTASSLYLDFLSGRDAARNCAIRAHFYPYVGKNAWGPGWGGPLVADLPTPGKSDPCPDGGMNASACDSCGAVSVGILLHFVRARPPVVDAIHTPVPPRFTDIRCDGG